MSCEEDRSIHPLTIIFHLIVFGVVGFFVYEVLDSYRPVLSKVIYRIFVLLLVILVVLMLAAANYFFVMFRLGIEEKSLANQHSLRKLNSLKTTDLLVASTAKSVEEGRVFLDKYKVDELAFSVKALPRPRIVKPEVEIKELESAVEIKNTILDDLSYCQRLLISGGSGTGKTTLLLHIAAMRSNLGELIILDLDGKVDKWGSYSAIGQGDDAKAIEIELDRINSIFKQRSLQYASGEINEREFPLITIIADEWHEMSAAITDLAGRTKKILTRGRKLGIDLIISSNGLTAESLGLGGQMDLIHNFEGRVRLDKELNKRLIYVSFGKSKQEIVYEHPGQFKGFVNQTKKEYLKPDFVNSLESIMKSPIDNEMDFEKKVLGSYYKLKKENKLSLNAICVDVFGYKNGKKTKQVTEILEKSGLKTD